MSKYSGQDKVFLAENLEELATGNKMKHHKNEI